MGDGAAEPQARRWSELHHGIDPADVPLLRAWLISTWTLARPLVRLRVPPTTITVAGVVLGVVAVVVAREHPWAALAAVVLAALCDALDGAVAVLAGAATRYGARADAVADRVVDVAFALVLWRCGAPLAMAVPAAVLAVEVDLARRVRRCPTVITVAERPSWTVCAGIACLASALSGARWPVLVCAGVWVALGAAGLGQVLTARSGRPVGPASGASRDGIVGTSRR